MPTCSATSSATFTLDGVAMAPRTTRTITFDGGRVQSIPVTLEAAQNDPFTHYLGAGLNVAVRVKATNNTGWSIGVAYNGNAAHCTLPPGGYTEVACPGEADVVDAMDEAIFQLDFVLTSALGTPGTIDTEVLGAT